MRRWVFLLALAAGACSSGGGGHGAGDATVAGDAATGGDAGVRADMGPSCTAGADGCPCGPMAPCADGRACRDGQCVDLPMRGLNISDPAARACELYLVESGASHVANVRFADGVRGRVVRQAPAVAVAFVRQADEAFAPGSVALEIDGPADGVTIRSAACSDRLGRSIPGVQVTSN